MESEYLIERRELKLGKKKETKKVYKIPPRSKKRIKEQKEYVKKVKLQVLKDDRCKIKSPNCSGKMEGFDHRQKRSPKNFLEDKNLVPACAACNLYKEQHPVWARNNGFDISRFKK